jgi:pimeloyl-ACP methyl ester carboxylesterase
LKSIYFNGWGFPKSLIPMWVRDAVLEDNIYPIDVYSVDFIFNLGVSNFKDFFLKNYEYKNKPFLLIAWSTGGMIALELVLELSKLGQIAPNSSLIIFSSSGNFINNEDSRLIALNHLRRLLSRSIDTSENLPLINFYKQLLDETKNYNSLVPSLEDFLKTYHQLSNEGLIKALNYLEITSLLDKLNNINIQVDIYHGENDTIIPKEHGIELKKSIPGSTFTLIKNAGHLLPFTHGKEILSSYKKSS